MESRKIGIGIIGYGNISPFHIKSIEELDNCELIAVQSSSSEKRERIESNHNVMAFESYTEMIALKEIELIIICTPSGFHLEPALDAMKAGKHVIVEKPLEVTTARCNQMINTSKEHNVNLSCIFQNRYSADFKKMLNAIQSGRLGKLLLGRVSVNWKRDQDYYNASIWRGTIIGDGGAVLINQGIHSIDLLLQLMGPVKSVSGNIATLVHDIEGEDVATASIQFENGAVGSIEASTAMYMAFPEKIEVHGEKGSIILEGGKFSHWETEADGKLEIEENNSSSGAADPLAIDYTLHKNQLNDIVDAIIKGNIPPVSAEDAMQSVALIEGIYKSSEEGIVIDFQD